MKARLGTPKAITATAHKLARLVYHLLKHGSASVQQGLAAYEAPYRERKVTTMAKQAKALGYTLGPLVSQGEHDQPRPPCAPQPPACLLRLLDTTCCEGKGRRACSQPGNRGHLQPRGAYKAGSASQKGWLHLSNHLSPYS